jgi:Protein of unknown function (DUF3747)
MQRSLVALSGLIMGTTGLLTSGALTHVAVATTFDQQEVEQSRYVAIARPLATGYFRLIVLNQITDARPCWSETGANPTRIEPLLNTFDFTGICGRGTDSNGYSIRVEGRDLGMRFSLQLEPRGDELWLVGRENGSAPNAPYMLIGRTNGVATDGLYRIYLQPGWRFTRRTYEGKTLGHIYFTNDSMSAALNQRGVPPTARMNVPSSPEVTTPRTLEPPPALPGSVPPSIVVPVPVPTTPIPVAPSRSRRTPLPAPLPNNPAVFIPVPSPNNSVPMPAPVAAPVPAANPVTPIGRGVAVPAPNSNRVSPDSAPIIIPVPRPRGPR